MRTMRSPFVCLLLAGFTLAVVAASAGATTFCVQNPSCPAGGVAQTTIQNAINAAAGSLGTDRILLGPVTFAEGGLNAAAGNPVDIVGAGAGQTTIAPPAAATVTTLTLADPSSTISDLTVSLAAGTNETGLALGGTARRVTVTAADGTTGTGVSLGVGSGGTFLDGTVSLPTTGATTGVSSVGSGTVATSSITAGAGVSNVATVQRVRIVATNAGIFVNPTTTAITTTVDDALVRLVGSAAGSALSASSGISTSFAATLIARHVTAIGNDNANATGIRSSSLVTVGGAQTTNVTASHVILRNFGIDLARSATTLSSGASAFAQLTIAFSDVDPFKSVNTNTVLSGGTTSGTIADGGGNLTVNPGFRDAAGGDFSLAAGSPLIDRGDSSAAAIGEPATDLAGNARVVDGNGDGSAVTDIGAFEFVPSAPPPLPPPPPPPPTSPTLTGLSLTPARFALGAGATAKSAAHKRRGAARGTTIHFTLSRAARVTLTIQRVSSGRRSGGHCAKPTRKLRKAKACTRFATVVALTRNGKGGANAVPFSGRVGHTSLSPGSYRLLAIATADGLASKSRTATFTVVTP